VANTRTNPIQSNANKRAQVFLFARIFYKITHNLKHAHLRFQLTQNENCKEHLAPSQFLSRQLLKVLSVSASTTKSGKLFHIFTTREEKENFLNLYWLALFL